MYAVMLCSGGIIAIISVLLRNPKPYLGLEQNELFVQIYSDKTSKFYILLGMLFALATGLVFAKLFYVVGNLKYVISGEKQFIELFLSGFMFFGGLFGGILGVALFSLAAKINFVHLLDILSPSLALGQSIGRIGCFCAGCCHGVETTSPIGIAFISPVAGSAPVGVPLVPIQLFESVVCFLLFLFLVAYSKKKYKSGNVFLLYVNLYAAARFVLEFWRGDNIRGFVGILSTSQFIGILIFIISFVLIILRKIFKKRTTLKVTSSSFLDNNIY